MKFCVIEDVETGKLLGSEYEEPYRYSEYTAGGDTWTRDFVPRDCLCMEPKEYDGFSYVVSIFESREKAQLYLDKNMDWCKREKRIVNLGEL